MEVANGRGERDVRAEVWKPQAKGSSLRCTASGKLWSDVSAGRQLVVASRARCGVNAEVGQRIAGQYRRWRAGKKQSSMLSDVYEIMRMYSLPGT
jgi:hypothetical protein